MQDVANRAGVSISTVSYVLNGTRPVSEKTKKLIFDTMEEMGYRPHALARGLASRRSHILSLLFTVPERGLGLTELEFITSAANTARECGYHLVLWTADFHDPAELRERVIEGLIDGMVVMEVREQDERVEVLREMGIPFTAIGRCENNDGITYADIDFDATTSEAVAHLATLGHHDIAFLNQSRAVYDEGYGPAVRVHDAFLSAARDAECRGIALFSHATPTDGYRETVRLLEEHPMVTAMVVMNDRALPGVLQALSEGGRAVPDDFSVVSLVSSSGVAEMFVPQLTSMEAPAAALGRLGVDYLVEQLDSSAIGGDRQILVPCNMVERGSTGPSPTR